MSPTTTPTKEKRGNLIAYSKENRQRAVDEGLALVALQVRGFRFIGAVDPADAVALESLLSKWHKARQRELRTIRSAANRVAKLAAKSIKKAEAAQ